MKRSSRRVLIGMSGGVDSSVAAALLVEQGYEVIGITIKTYRYEDVGGNVGNDSSCCSLDGINDARRVCMALDIPHYTVDFSGVFKANIIDYFSDAYMSGDTPNPCVKCNRLIKWGEMLKKADFLGAEYVAMGHYAKICRNESESRYFIRRGADSAKDQSYMLWGLTQESLARTLFPLSEFTKDEARRIAADKGLPVAAKGESYEICFIPDNNYKRFLRDTVTDFDQRVGGEGDIVLDGEIIGKHQGYPFYTTGQRKGLGLSHPEPLYVLDVIPETNTVRVGKEENLDSHELYARSVNFQKYPSLPEAREFTVKIRYKDPGATALCISSANDELHVQFPESRRAITRGQSVVLYERDDLVAGGVISAAPALP